jgi:hypothetical protein
MPLTTPTSTPTASFDLSITIVRHNKRRTKTNNVDVSALDSSLLKVLLLSSSPTPSSANDTILSSIATLSFGAFQSNDIKSWFALNGTCTKKLWKTFRVCVCVCVCVSLPLHCLFSLLARTYRRTESRRADRRRQRRARRPVCSRCDCVSRANRRQRKEQPALRRRSCSEQRWRYAAAVVDVARGVWRSIATSFEAFHRS